MAQLTPAAEIVGAVDTPGGISAVSPEPCGTVAGDQLAAVAQSLLVAPVHVKTAMRASRSSFGDGNETGRLLHFFFPMQYIL
jgi:hypothetical protein